MMEQPHENHLPKRKSIRLNSYDYAQNGLYYLTICTHNKQCLFGKISDGSVHLNSYGEIVEHEWLRTAGIRKNMTPLDYVVMPNHFHGIIAIDHEQALSTKQIDRQHPATMEKRSLSSFVAGFKSSVTAKIKQRNGHDITVWQRNYYEHVIRDEKELQILREYISLNPLKWELDTLYPDNMM
ncbi:transposase [Prosthecochloris sp. ZM_2]|uniref:transposase n=1 Tax=Prosthecochloris sp. ZM_2 TaxID=2045206 RepID=UPI0018F72FDB|nr:transposase [Prosthecochloris sp. ZM_2]